MPVRPSPIPSPRRADRTEPFERSRDYVESLARGLEVLRSVGDLERPVTFSAIAGATGLSRAAVRRLILKLEHLGYVQSDGAGFVVTARVLEFGHGVLRAESLTDVARPSMRRLADRIHESCSLAVLDDQEIVYVARVAVRKVMTVALSVGARLPAFCTSMGRVLVAGLERDARVAWLERCKPTAFTPRTITDRARLRLVLERVRRDGYAWVEQELEMGLCSLAVPLKDREGRVVAALNTGMPFQSAARERALGDLLPALRETAAQIERAMPPAAFIQAGR
ncbi:MAG TPA: IclR family transcriptional regulator C-terminal domain-containing protein [Steroidobacteraceae bacterium]|nr:IclR family transcriptional regulator C-terminal domain-containing protein [Steroidobacteraceae bacterium]